MTFTAREISMAGIAFVDSAKDALRKRGIECELRPDKASAPGIPTAGVAMSDFGRLDINIFTHRIACHFHNPKLLYDGLLRRETGADHHGRRNFGFKKVNFPDQEYLDACIAHFNGAMSRMNVREWTTQTIHLTVQELVEQDERHWGLRRAMGDVVMVEDFDGAQAREFLAQYRAENKWAKHSAAEWLEFMSEKDDAEIYFQMAELAERQPDLDIQYLLNPGSSFGMHANG